MRSSALDRRRVDQPGVIEASLGVGGQPADQNPRLGGSLSPAFVVARLVGDVGNRWARCLDTWRKERASEVKPSSASMTAKVMSSARKSFGARPTTGGSRQLGPYLRFVVYSRIR